MSDFDPDEAKDAGIVAALGCGFVLLYLAVIFVVAAIIGFVIVQVYQHIIES